MALIFLIGGLFTGEQKEQSSGQQLALESQVIQEESAAPAEQSEGNSESKVNRGESSKAYSKQPNEKRSDSGRKSFPSSEQGSSPLNASSAIISVESNPTTEAFTEAVPQQVLASSVQAAPPFASLGEEKVVGQPTTSAPNYAEIVPSEAAELLAQQKDPLSFAVGLGPGFGNSNAGQPDHFRIANWFGNAGGYGSGGQATHRFRTRAQLPQSGIRRPGIPQIGRCQFPHPRDFPGAAGAGRPTPVCSLPPQSLTGDFFASWILQFADLQPSHGTEAGLYARGISFRFGKLPEYPKNRASHAKQYSPRTEFSIYSLCPGQPWSECSRIRKQKNELTCLMPFYSYPLQDISGTGQNPAVVGAAFKITFGTLKK